MSYLKTKVNSADVIAFIDGIEDEIQKADSFKIIEMLKTISGYDPKMWGKNKVGFGNFFYKTKAGKEGEWFLIGFSPNKSTISLHLMFGLEDEKALLDTLGKHKLSKGCLYIKTLTDVDEAVLKEIMINTLARMKKENNNG